MTNHTSPSISVTWPNYTKDQTAGNFLRAGSDGYAGFFTGGRKPWHPSRYAGEHHYIYLKITQYKRARSAIAI